MRKNCSSDREKLLNGIYYSEAAQGQRELLEYKLITIMSSLGCLAALAQTKNCLTTKKLQCTLSFGILLPKLF